MSDHPSGLNGANGINGSGSSVHPLRKSYKYFIAGGDLHFVVADVRFRVHSYFFDRESSKFRKTLSQSSSSGSVLGSSLSNPLVLHDVTPEQFEEFLWVFYNPSHSVYEAAVGTWASILRLANRWDFPEVRKLAIRELESKVLDAVDRILIYQEQDVELDLIIPLYTELVDREAFITPEEYRKLGDKTTVMILQARERLRAKPPNAENDAEVDAEIRKLVEEMIEMFPPTPPLEVSASSPLTPKAKANGINHVNGV
ncbi:hypothetical protein VKT23_000500 [Stygiomarasmius scandens]|uniref:BTB domain-containing protein n=1 Tax=Marasmiellus scandens TaxID=2682957 RepID=A0ABR1K7M1_9AGAR